MNEIIQKKNMFKYMQNKISKNIKFYIILLVFFVIILTIFQFYLFDKKNKILKTSVNYNIAKSYDSLLDFDDAITIISKEKNFYGILASLEKIKIKIDNNNINSAYKDYLNLINEKNLSNNYKSIIAIHGSYSLLGKISNYNLGEISIDEFSLIINNLLSFIDISLETYYGFKLEIQYLLNILDTDINNIVKLNDKIINLYDEIQDNNMISSSVKERVKKIHEFQKYK